MGKRKKKKDKPLSSACIYCKHFHEADKRYENGKTRICALVNKQVASNDENCQHFELHRYVWCPEFKKWYINTICQHRTNRPCNNCKVGAYVRKVLPELREMPKPTLKTHTNPGTYQKVDLPAHLRPKTPIVLRHHTVAADLPPKRRKIVLATHRTSKADGEVTISRREITV